MNDQDIDHNNKQNLIDHLIELRNRVLITLAIVLAIFLALLPFSQELYTLLAQPLLEQLPENANMIATDVASPFTAPLKLTLLLAVFISIPLVLYQMWAFIAPGLYKKEKKLIFPVLVASVFLFYLGPAFVFFIVFPIVFKFFTSIAPTGVIVMTDISSYLDFVIVMFLAFGIVFEVPIITIVLIKLNIISIQQISSKRPYIIIAAFVLGMILTPPDVATQILLALSMWLLFEIGLLIAKLMNRGK